MVDLLDNLDYVCHADLGLGTKSIAYFGGIQYAVDMA